MIIPNGTPTPPKTLMEIANELRVCEEIQRKNLDNLRNLINVLTMLIK